MKEQQDDTAEPDEPSRTEERERKPGSYYYDDSTGYEIYDPTDGEEDAENDEM